MLQDFQFLTYARICDSGRSEAHTNTSVQKEDRSNILENDLGGLVYLSKMDRLTGSGCLIRVNPEGGEKGILTFSSFSE